MRRSGVLMHISSLPSPYGIGTMGAQAREFVDFLVESGQSCWQVLPVSPTGFGDSPYQSFSSFAGNPYFIDLDMLCKEGLLKRSEYENTVWCHSCGSIDYGLLYEKRFDVLRLAADRLIASPPEDFYQWCESNGFWLNDFSLFMAIKASQGGCAWSQWERPLKFREAQALNAARSALADKIAYYKALQYLFFSQWKQLRRYANERGISIIGDIPIYVSPDSSDVWANPQWFKLDDELQPIEVAGCPPDGFSENGQLWGNPLYDWDKLRDNGFSWWVSRIAHQFEIFDILRLDHFRGFDAYYAIPRGESTARNGRWLPGPGIDFFNTVNYALGKREYIAEDLGFLTDSVAKLLKESGLPGMKVLQFAFDSREDSDYLPHNYTHNCVAYTGTHDNDTILGWFASAPAADTEKAMRYLRIRENESKPKAMISALLASTADLAIVTVQDLLELGSEGRMNTPSTNSGNWQWQMKKNALTKAHAKWLKEQTVLYGRAAD